MANIPQDVAVHMLRNALVSTINQYRDEPYGINLYDIDFILREIYQEVSSSANAELQSHMSQYQQALQQEKDVQIDTLPMDVEIQEDIDIKDEN